MDMAISMVHSFPGNLSQEAKILFNSKRVRI